MLPPPDHEANPLAPAKASGHNGPQRRPGPLQLVTATAVRSAACGSRRENQRRKRVSTSMNIKHVTIAAAIGSLLAVGAANADQHQGKEAKVKCYGVAKAGNNDCATASHSCAGSSKKDNDPTEWKQMPQAECEKAGGKVGDDAKKPM
jgi:uncharacterized membrane protein